MSRLVAAGAGALLALAFVAPPRQVLRGRGRLDKAAPLEPGSVVELPLQAWWGSPDRVTVQIVSVRDVIPYGSPGWREAREYTGRVRWLDAHAIQMPSRGLGAPPEGAEVVFRRSDVLDIV